MDQGLGRRETEPLAPCPLSRSPPTLNSQQPGCSSPRAEAKAKPSCANDLEYQIKGAHPKGNALNTSMPEQPKTGKPCPLLQPQHNSGGEGPRVQNSQPRRLISDLGFCLTSRRARSGQTGGDTTSPD